MSFTAGELVGLSRSELEGKARLALNAGLRRSALPTSVPDCAPSTSRASPQPSP